MHSQIQKLIWPWWFLILEKRRKRRRGRKVISVTIEQVILCQLPAIRDLNGSEIGKSMRKITPLPASVDNHLPYKLYQGNSPLMPEPPASSIAFLPLQAVGLQPCFFKNRNTTFQKHFSLSEVLMNFRDHRYFINWTTFPLIQFVATSIGLIHHKPQL